jgi:hypothetical protein
MVILEFGRRGGDRRAGEIGDLQVQRREASTQALAERHGQTHRHRALGPAHGGDDHRLTGVQGVQQISEGGGVGGLQGAAPRGPVCGDHELVQDGGYEQAELLAGERAHG